MQILNRAKDAQTERQNAGARFSMSAIGSRVGEREGFVSRAAVLGLQGAVLITLLAIPTLAAASTDLAAWRVVSWMVGGVMLLWILGDAAAGRCRFFVGRAFGVLAGLVMVVVIQFVIVGYEQETLIYRGTTLNTPAFNAASIGFIQASEAALLIVVTATAFASGAGGWMFCWVLSGAGLLAGGFVVVTAWCENIPGSGDAMEGWETLWALRCVAVAGVVAAAGLGRDAVREGGVRRGGFGSDHGLRLVGSALLGCGAGAGILASGEWSAGVGYGLFAGVCLMLGGARSSRVTVLRTVAAGLAVCCVGYLLIGLGIDGRAHSGSLAGRDWGSWSVLFGHGVLALPADGGDSAMLTLTHRWGIFTPVVAGSVGWWAIRALLLSVRPAADASGQALRVAMGCLGLEYLTAPTEAAGGVLLFAGLLGGAHLALTPRHNPAMRATGRRTGGDTPVACAPGSDGATGWRPSWQAAGLILTASSVWVLVPISPVLASVSARMGHDQDLYYHVVGGFGMGLLACWGLGSVGRGGHLLWAAVGGCAVSCGVAFGIEFVQWAATHRSVELADAVAHCRGTVVGAAVFAVGPLCRQLVGIGGRLRKSLWGRRKSSMFS